MPSDELDLSSQKLSELNASALEGINPSLKKIDYNGNELTTVPADAFAKLGAVPILEELNLYGNKIKEIPVGALGGLKHLKILNVFNNQMKKLPADVGALEELEEVNFAANKLMMTDNAKFLSWKNVKVLNLYDNNLVRMGSLAPLVAIEELRISGNNLEEMPILCDSCPITVLEIHKNRIAEIDAAYFEKTASLERLSIWGNLLKELPTSLLSCEGLLGVQAQENQLTSLPAGKWPADLETLFVQENPALTELPVQLSSCAKLKRVNLGKLKLEGEMGELESQLRSMVLGGEGGIFWTSKGERLEQSKGAK
eukprot:CAMPEP_0115849998 /NCGR_PEP_ID=MMETSP0287-20121206/11738_1 /TAXON_ID=412157 /ORGANISM="Chrysochromulina rotalis, Strain UIO044" /LENGTH=311 /DNA_ID=CAMNT_0003303983 /DNA_START=28 /DNA_END=963 /DNA_ORIENTATION=-